MLSLRSQRKVIPEVWSNITSDGRLCRRHPDSEPKTQKAENEIEAHTDV